MSPRQFSYFCFLVSNSTAHRVSHMGRIRNVPLPPPINVRPNCTLCLRLLSWGGAHPHKAMGHDALVSPKGEKKFTNTGDQWKAASDYRIFVSFLFSPHRPSHELIFFPAFLSPSRFPVPPRRLSTSRSEIHRGPYNSRTISRLVSFSMPKPDVLICPNLMPFQKSGKLMQFFLLSFAN